MNKIYAMITGLLLSGALVIGNGMPAQAEKKDKATDKDYSVNVALYTKECCDEWSWNSDDPTEWTEPQTDAIHIDSDGRYALKLEGLQVPSEKLCLCYIKDADVYAKKIKKSNLPKDIKVNTEKVIVNGESLPINDYARTGMLDDAFDVAYHNDWKDDDNAVDFTAVETVESIEVIFTVEGLGGEYTTNIEEGEDTTGASADTANSDTASSDVQNAGTDATTTQNKSMVPLVAGIAIAVVVVAGVIIVVKKRK